MHYRLIEDTPASITVTVDGMPTQLPGGRSALAGLLVAGKAPPMFCAIGQCQRCAVRINGREDIACLTFPVEGDDIETTIGVRSDD